MSKLRSRGEGVRKFILENVEKHPKDISSFTANHFGTTRQAVNKHLKKLVVEKSLTENGLTKNRTYALAQTQEWTKEYVISPELAEDIIWREDILPALGKMPDNVNNIWHYGFSEMFNNAIDHSDGSSITVIIRKTALDTKMDIFDNGVGIFKKIQTSLNLLDERHAVLELSKGKLTTDPKRHTGEGIFFSSRMFDSYHILAGGVSFSHRYEYAIDLISEIKIFDKGTNVRMELHNHTARTAKKIFDQYTSGDDYGFTKTVVPVQLAQYEKDDLVSRSQAKRLLARVQQFKIVVFDFENVDSVGQAFADEIFRVFALQHPEIELQCRNVNKEVKQWIDRAQSALKN